MKCGYGIVIPASAQSQSSPGDLTILVANAAHFVLLIVVGQVCRGIAEWMTNDLCRHGLDLWLVDSFEWDGQLDNGHVLLVRKVGVILGRYLGIFETPSSRCRMR